MPIILMRYLPHIVAVAVLVGGGVYLRHHWISQGEAAGRAAEAAALRERDAAIAALEASQKASEGYANELKEIRNRPVVRQPVRLCVAPNLPVPGTPSGTDGPASGSGELPEVAGPDIGDRLYSDARRADELAAQLRALQEWINQVSK